MTIAPKPSSQSTDARPDLAPERAGDRHEPNGSAAAALLAAGIGSAVLGVDIVLAEAWKPISRAFNVYAPGGPLTGQTMFATVVWLSSWALLHVWLDDRDVDLRPWLRATMVLVGLGLLGTFPPFYRWFAH